MSQNPLSRRKFIQMGFATMGTAAVAPVAGAVESLTRPGRSVTVGVLLPRAQLHPLLSANILDGLRLGFSTTSHAARFQTRQIGTGETSAVSAARGLLDAGIRVVVGMVSTSQLEAIQPLFAEYGATFVHATAGENITASPLSNVVVNSLQYWQSAYAAGQWAVGQFGRRAMLLSSFYESGFDTLYAAGQGIESAGGSVLDTHVTHMHPSFDRLADALDAVRSTNPDFVYTAYQGQQAVAFLHAYRSAGLETPLVASAFMLDSADVSVPARSVTPWAADLKSPENSAFLDAFGQSTGRTADSFAVLGFETGHWIGAALDTAAGNSALLRAAMAATRVVGPRGALTFDAASQSLTSALVVRSIDQQVKSFQAVDAPVFAHRPDIKTGWITPYLSV